MSVFKCKMCGGTLEITGGESVATCDYCGTQQTLPRTSDDVIQNLFNRANNLRLKSEFDKAEQLYEKILEKDNTEAEAHWGIVLCKYGIEYVEDPKTMERVPTCHRTLFDAVTTNADYLAAIEHSDALQKSIYEKEARAIDEIQKDILKIAKNEEPFDVFICYKETDDSGKRTVDSTIANDIYYQLTREGLKVFYAAITLEDKLGQEYEPYIFAALNSAKVMLVLGTKPEYFTAVWVKNEWSRYLKLLKNDRSKMLIPCYRDMDAYELPEEFSHLQAQDMSKIGFMQDVIRGIKKVTAREENNNQLSKPQSSKSTDSNVESLLKRAFMFVEDGDFETAEKYCEKVLDSEPENTDAYLCKLMIAKKVTTKEKLRESSTPLEQDSNYLRILRTGDEKLVNELKKYNEETKKSYGVILRKQRFKKTIKRMFIALAILAVLAIIAAIVWTFFISPMMKYEDANALLDDGKYDEAIVLFEELEDYEDSEQLLIKSKYLKGVELFNNSQYAEAAVVFEELGDYEDSANIVLEAKYRHASRLYQNKDYSEAYTIFFSIPDYKDSSELADSVLEYCSFAIKSDISEGDSRTFGKYEQDNNLSNGPEDIQWVVVKKDEENNRVLVVSKYVLDSVQYNNVREDVTWETCSLRKWLNEDFCEKAFTEEDLKLISKVGVEEDRIVEENSSDHMFILNWNEYLNGGRMGFPTAYASANGIECFEGSGACSVWNRRKSVALKAVYNTWYGEVYSTGDFVDETGYGVRPAMWIDLSKIQ